MRAQFVRGPKPGTQVEAAAKAADIPERTLIAAASVLGTEGSMVDSGTEGDLGAF